MTFLYILGMLVMACFGVLMGIGITTIEKGGKKIPLFYRFVIVLVLALMSSGMLYLIRLGGALWRK